ncbi:Hypothetical protein SCLAV_5264 [Streptomyces clavuligerus]|uniref:Uncharacterized protein n=1 Tax=Streptomyces clavuligerus TaxID=1901 RepID=E2PZ76_STRCL|nr:Hypothetical protein SCLAV_5264 [Streptomyces clavuligerus]
MDHRTEFQHLVRDRLGDEAAGQILWSNPRLICSLATSPATTSMPYASTGAASILSATGSTATTTSPWRPSPPSPGTRERRAGGRARALRQHRLAR